MLEEPRSQFPFTRGFKPAQLVQDRISKADAIILLASDPMYEVPTVLQDVKEHCNGHVYSWRCFGVCCTLLGGSVNSRRVAMQLRALLEDCNHLIVGRILPEPSKFEKMYSVDPLLETGEPCVT